MLVLEKRAFVVPFHLGAVNAADRQIHSSQSPRGLVALLTIDGNIIDLALAAKDEFLRLHEHTARTTARIKKEDYSTNHVLIKAKTLCVHVQKMS